MPRIGDVVLYTHPAGAPVAESAAVIQRFYQDGRVDLLVFATVATQQFYEIAVVEGIGHREWQRLT